MAGRNDDNSNNLPGDFLKSRRSNNTRPTRSSNTKSSKETDDTLKDLDLTSRKVKEVNEQKLKSEKKITEEKQKQNKEDDKQLRFQNQQVNMLKEFQKTQKQIVQSQYDQGKILNYINNYVKENDATSKEAIKLEREKAKALKDELDQMEKKYSNERKHMDDSDFILSYVQRIVTINGEATVPALVENYVQEMNARDLRAFDIEYGKISNNVGLDLTYTCQCPTCGAEMTFQVPLVNEFFRPTFD